MGYEGSWPVDDEHEQRGLNMVGCGLAKAMNSPKLKVYYLGDEDDIVRACASEETSRRCSKGERPRDG